MIGGFAGLGYGQAWQDVKVSRVLGVVYYNTTGKPLAVWVSATSGGNNISQFLVFINGQLLGLTSGNANNPTQGMFIVPPSQSYEVSANSINPTIDNWVELR